MNKIYKKRAAKKTNSQQNISHAKINRQTDYSENNN